MARAATLRGVTADVEEIAFFMAIGTDLGGSRRGDGISTVVALPEGQTATWTNIPDKFTCRGVTTQGTLHFSLFLFHMFASSFLWFAYMRWCRCIQERYFHTWND